MILLCLYSCPPLLFSLARETMHVHYHPLNRDTACDISTTDNFEKTFEYPSSNNRQFRFPIQSLWVFSTGFFAILSLLLAQNVFQHHRLCAQEVHGYATDFQDVSRLTRLERREFHSRLRYNTSSGAMDILYDERKSRYVGDPAITEGIDNAWKELLAGKALLIISRRELR